MDLSARDIHEKQFHDSWRGYNQEEVDEFLDRVADVLDRLQRENAAVHARVTELDHAVATSRDTEEMLKKTLITAQQAAEEAIASAKAKAEALIQEAEERTRRVHREADEKMQAADAEARRKSLEADREHTIRKREIDTSLEKLRRFESDLKRRLAAFLQDQTRGLERLTEEEPPRYQPARAMPEPEPQADNEAGGGQGAAATADETVAQAVDETAAEEGTSDDDRDVPTAEAQGGDATGRWIPEFIAAKEAENGEGEDAGGSWEEPGFVHEKDDLTLQDDDTPDESGGEDELDTVTLGDETAPARQRSSRLFWRGDG